MNKPSTLHEMRAQYGANHRWLVLAALMVGVIASVMSSTIVNVAIPDMSRYFALDQARAQWVTSGFMVAMTVSMLTTPWLLSRYGYRRTYMGTMLLLLAGGICGGISNTFSLVLAARAAEGLAAGVVQPIPAIIIMRAFGSHEQGRASGIFGMGVVLAPALGPSIGGVLVDLFGWRSIFFMVVPFCLASLWMGMRYVPVTAPGGVAVNANGASLDWRGLLLASASTLGLLNGMLMLHRDGVTQGLALMGLASLGLLVFIAWQKRMVLRGQEPLMNLGLFANRQFVMGSIVAFIYGTAMFGSTYLFPVYMQLGLGMSASYVGSILLPAGAVLALTIVLVGRLADRRPPYLLVSIGLVLLSLSFALMLTITLTSAIWILVLWAMVGRMGLGFILPSLNLAALRPLDKGLLSQGASSINFLRMLGGAIGVSMCGIVLDWRLFAHGASLTQGASDPGRLAAFNESFMMLAAICVLALFAAWRLREPSISR